MLVAPHFLVGTAIAMSTLELGPAVLAAITSHFVLDSIPHRDTIGGFHLNKSNIIMEFFDAIVTFGIFFILVPPHLWLYAFAVSLVAILPDLIEIVGLVWPKWYTLPIIKPFHQWHTDTLQHDDEGMNWFWGLLPQVVIILAVIWLVKF
ncbi:hypothetical protein KJ836_03620 [Patescibacteria group bacterium]|nr:hypothetical protein [Patescibacteria group bacterium]